MAISFDSLFARLLSNLIRIMARFQKVGLQSPPDPSAESILRYSLRVTNNPHKASDWIKNLQLKPHPEGGYYRETYRSNVMLAREALPPGFSGPRPASTAIYFLVEGENFSAFHRLRSDELWHFYAGSPLRVHGIDPAGVYSAFLLGNDPKQGHIPQAVVAAGSWFGSHVAGWRSWSLMGCTVSPGFDFADFEIGQRAKLTAQFPQHRQIIQRLTRG